MSISLNKPNVTSFHQKQIGKQVTTSDERLLGVVEGVSYRYCAACRRNAVCYVVKWNNGKKSYPCAKGVKVNENMLII